MLKRIFCIVVIAFVAIGIAFGITQFVNYFTSNEPEVITTVEPQPVETEEEEEVIISALIKSEEPVEEVEEPIETEIETEIEKMPTIEEFEAAIKYVDTTIISMLDDINADAEMASGFWLNVKVAVSGFLGGSDEVGFYLISDDMNYAFDSIYCVNENSDNIKLDTPIIVYGEVINVDSNTGYTIDVDKIEVRD